MIAPLHGTHRTIASVFIGQTADEIVKQAITHGAVGHIHAFDSEHIEDLGENRKPAREHRPSLIRQRGERDVAHVIRSEHSLDHRLKTFGCDGASTRIQFANRITHRLDGA